MTKKNKVSILLTSYNHAKYLHEAINSVLNQTFTDFELVIWDDASTDESWEIINSFSDPRIRPFRNETPQIITSVNASISEAVTGEYIAIHHSDDTWEPQKLEKQVAFLNANPQIGAVFTRAKIINENGESFQDQSHFYYKIFEQPNRTRHEWLNYFFYHGNALCHPSLLIRKVCYTDCGFYRYGLGQLPDFDMWVRLCLKYEIHILPEKLVRFRIRANESNASGIRPETQIRWRFEFLQVLENYKSISNIQELIQIFPNAEKYVTPRGHDLGFALGMTALDAKTNQPTQLFGLNTLFALFSDPVRMQRIQELYGFSQFDFLALTAERDVFSVELPDKLNRIIVEQDAQIATMKAKLDSALTTISEIYASKSWRLMAPLRWLRTRQRHIEQEISYLLVRLRQGLDWFVRQIRRTGYLLKSLFLFLLRPRGILTLFRNAVNVWRREGLPGVLSSIRFYIGYYLADSGDYGEFAINSMYYYLRSGKKEMLPGASAHPEAYNPKVSVIVPNYDHAIYLEERLDSIYGQTYQNFEVILLDDCSTDNSVAILQKYASQYPDRTRCHFNEVNSGSPFSQWEKGISLAEGDLIWIAESDDFCDKDFLEKLIPFFFNEAILLSYAQPVFVNEKGKQHVFAFEQYVGQIDSRKWHVSYIETAHNEVNTALGLLNTIPNVSGVLFRKLDSHFTLFSDPAWKKMRVCGDWLFYLHLIRGGALAYSHETHNYYRMYESSTSKKTHSQDVYYQEHEQVALAAASLYKISGNLISKLQARLKAFYFKNVHDGSVEKFDALFNLNKINQSMQSRRPNVLMTTYGLATGGGEIFPIRLANALHKAGATVTLFNGGYELTQPGVRKMLSPQIALITNFSAIHINNILANFGIEIIHTHHASMENYFAVTRSLRTKGIKHIATLHGMYEMMNEADFMHNTSRILKSVDYWIYTAEKNILPFIKNGLFTVDKFMPMDNGLPIQKFNKVDLGPLGITPDSFTICLASRAIPEKGWGEAIEATQKARKITKTDLHLLLIGDGPMYDMLKTRDLPDYIHLLGFKANVGDYLSSVQLGLLPSYFKGESFPFVMIEFFIAEIPVIASNIGETARMIRTADHKIAGSLIELHKGKVDSNELADAIIKMVVDKEFYKECVNTTRILKPRFDIDNIAQQYLDVYKHIVGQRY